MGRAHLFNFLFMVFERRKTKMIKKTITFEDFDGNERTEDFYFNLTEAELTDLELSVSGGFGSLIDKITKTQDVPEIMKIFKQIIKLAYGIKSPDGRRFEKSEAIYNDFAQTNAFSQLYMELASDEQKASDFINGILPKKILDQTKSIQKNGDAPVLTTVADTNA
jgi:hypothetical protein